MAEIVAGVACSHVPFLAMHPEFERAGVEQRNRVVAGFEAARRILEEANPDAIVVFSNDHFDRCFYDNLPAFLVGVAEEAAGPAVAGFDVPQVRLPIASDLARYIV